MEHLFDKPNEKIDVLDLNISFDETVFDENILTNKLKLFLQEIYVAVMLAPNEIWGVSDSINLTQYLFNNYITTDFINAEISQYITIHCSQSANFRWGINTSIETDTENNEFIYITLNIESENGNVLKTFILGQ